MRKFRAVFKEKQSLSDGLHDKTVLNNFEKVYSALLEKYSISNFKTLNESNQTVFLAELNSYWDEKAGVLPKGKKFLAGNSDILNEKSTSIQKKNYMKKRTVPAISETFRQSGLKFKLYNIIDEMYKGIGAEELHEVLTSKEMTEIMVESFKESVKNFMIEVKYELTENSGSKKKTNEGIGNMFRPNLIKLSGHYDTSEARKTSKYLLSLLKASNLKASVSPNGTVKTIDKNMNLATITPEGYVYIPGAGNWGPDEFGRAEKDIITGMLSCSEISC